MKVAFDSSVIIAGTHDMRPHHGRAMVWIDAVLEQRITGVVTWHANSTTPRIIIPLDPPDVAL